MTIADSNEATSEHPCRLDTPCAVGSVADHPEWQVRQTQSHHARVPPRTEALDRSLEPQRQRQD
eukprot:74419-Amphidinium_carterae.1